MLVTIRYCGAWGFKSKAASLAARIGGELELETVLERGGSGQFDVLADGELIASKTAAGLLDRLRGRDGFPDPDVVLDELRARLAR